MTQQELGLQERRHQSFRESDLFSLRGTASQSKAALQLHAVFPLRKQFKTLKCNTISAVV